MTIASPRTVALAAAAILITLVASPVSSTAETPATAGTARHRAPAELRVASFNLLGSSHTASGSKKWMGTGVERMGRTVRILNNLEVNIVGFQEMQTPQVAEFQRLRGRSWGLYPGARLRKLDGANSIAWRKSVWTLVKASTRPIPYFGGRVREMPFLLMRHNKTHRLAYFFNVHNPVSSPSTGNNDKWRTMAINKEIAAVNASRANSSIPVFVVGDMNDRELVFCPFHRRGAMHAANGGGITDTTCTMPRGPLPVDWVFATGGVAFHHYLRVLTPYVQRTTDHPVVVSSARLS